MSEEKKSSLAIGEQVSSKPKNGIMAWVVMILALCGTIAIYMCSKKLNPAGPMLLEYFATDTTFTGGLGSIYGIVSAILLIPLGALQAKFSSKWLFVIGLVVLAGGSVLGATCSGSATDMFTVARVIEAIGYATISAVGGVLITRWFDEEHRGLPMGIFTANVGIGQTVILNTATFVLPVWGWQGLWITCAVVALTVAVLVAIIVKDWPRGGEADAAKAAEAAAAKAAAPKAKITDSFKVPSFWLMAVMFACFGIGMQGTMMFSNSIFTQMAGVDNATASVMSSVMAIGQIFGPMIGGVVISKLSVNHKDIRGWACAIFFAMAFISEFSLLAFSVNEAAAWVTSFMMGFLVTWWAPCLYIIAADHAPSPALHALGISIFLFGQQIGGIVGPYVMGWFNATFGTFTAAKWLILGLAIIGMAAAILNAIIDRKHVLAQQAKEEA